VEKVLASKFSGSSTIPKAVKDDRMNMLNILFDESRGPTRDRVEQAMNQLFHGSKDIPEDVKEDRAQTLELLFNL
jgi:hypothetical protein